MLITFYFWRSGIISCHRFYQNSFSWKRLNSYVRKTWIRYFTKRIRKNSFWTKTRQIKKYVHVEKEPQFYNFYSHSQSNETISLFPSHNDRNRIARLTMKTHFPQSTMDNYKSVQIRHDNETNIETIWKHTSHKTYYTLIGMPKSAGHVRQQQGHQPGVWPPGARARGRRRRRQETPLQLPAHFADDARRPEVRRHLS